MKKVFALLFAIILLFNFKYEKFDNKFSKYNNYNEKKLKEYIEFSERFNIKEQDIIELVNNNLDSVEYIDTMKELKKQKYYIQSRQKRYLEYSDKGKFTIEEIVTNVNCNLDYEYYTHTKKTDIKHGKLMLVNKYYELGKNYNPNIVLIDPSYSAWGGLVSEANEAFTILHNDALKEGHNITNQSPYRSYDRQYSIYNRYVAIDGVEETDKVSARPGFSEHQTGYALDVGENFNDLNDFGNTESFKWMNDNAYKYGFILRYPKGKERLTGYDYEPWHYRYVGKEVAEYIYKNKITFDEYYAYYIEKEI